MANVVHRTLTDDDLHASERQYAGNPNGALTGIQGQYCEDTATGDVYRCNGGTSWERIINFELAKTALDARNEIGLGASDTPSFLSADFGLGTLVNQGSEISLKTYDTVDGVTVDFFIRSPSGAQTVGSNRTLTLPDATGTLAYWASGGTNNNYIVTSNGSNGLVGESGLTYDGSALSLTGSFSATGNVTLGDSRSDTFTVRPKEMELAQGLTAEADRARIKMWSYDDGVVASGWILLQAPVTDGNYTVTLPASTGTLPLIVSGTDVNNRVLTANGSNGIVGEANLTFDGSTLAVTGALTANTLDTGHGANELYAMNQNVRTTDSVTFAGLTTTGNSTFGDARSDTFTVRSKEIIVADGVSAEADRARIKLLTYDGAATLIGSITILTPITANDYTITLPAATGTVPLIVSGTDVDNRVLTANGSSGLVGEANLTFDGSTLAVTGAITATTLNTGQGAYELYAMNQNVRTTDAVTFATVNTGQGANELYAMNQDVRSTDSVTFASLTTTGNTTIGDARTDLFTSKAKQLILASGITAEADRASVLFSTYDNGAAIDGSVTLIAPITPNDYTVTLPAATGTLVLTNGTGATGTWGISITGDAATVDGYSMNQGVLTTSSPTFAGLNLGNGNLNEVENIYVDNQIISVGDTDTYMQFHAANEWRVVTGNAERIEANSNGLLVTGQISTGIGYTEVHLMNQNVRTTDSPTFDGLTVTNTINAQGELQENGINVARYRGGFTSAPTTDVQDGDIYSDTNFNPVRVYIRAESDWVRIA